MVRLVPYGLFSCFFNKKIIHKALIPAPGLEAMAFESLFYRLKTVPIFAAIVAVSVPQSKKEKLKSH
jgi:hypothetical protein